MSKFSKDAFHTAADAAAAVHVNKFMARETEANIKNLRAQITAEHAEPTQA